MLYSAINILIFLMITVFFNGCDDNKPKPRGLAAFYMDRYGHDVNGLNSKGFDKNGYDINGFNLRRV